MYPKIQELSSEMIKQNALSNLASRLWGILSLFLFVPFYIKYLGSTGFGYIAFYNTLLALFAFADLGFSAAITREFARLSSGDPESEAKKANLLHSYQIIYLLISVSVAFCIICASPWIAHQWLLPNSAFEVKTLVIFMGTCIAIQLPTNLYVGALMGAEKQVLANGLQILWGIIRSAGVIPVLIFISNDVNTFFIWQLLCNIVYLLALYYFVWKYLPVSSRRFDLAIIKKTYHYAFGMAGMSLLASFATQIDKIIVSKGYTIESVGHYSLASTLSLVPLILITTLAKAVFPKFTRLHEQKCYDELKDFYLLLTKLAVVILVPLSFIFAFFGFTLVKVWTGSDVVANSIQYVIVFLVLGQMLQSLTVLPFHLSLSFAYIRINLIFSFLMIIVSPVIYYLFLTGYGITGVSISVFITIVTVFVPYMYLLHQRLLNATFTSWFKLNIIVLSVCGLIIYMFSVMDWLDSNSILKSTYHAFFAWLAMCIASMLATGMRNKKTIIYVLNSLR